MAGGSWKPMRLLDLVLLCIHCTYVVYDTPTTPLLGFEEKIS